MTLNEIRPLEEVIKRTILEAIIACDFNLSEATARLGVARCTVYRKLKEWGLEVTQAQNMKRTEMIRRCQAIEKALEEMNGRTESC